MSVRRSVVAMAVGTVASRILGLARFVVIAAILGTTALGNTFQSTNSISNILFDLLAAGAISAALVPQLVRADKKGIEELRRVSSSLITLSLVVLGAISIIGVICAEPIASMLFHRAPIATREDQIRVGTFLLRFFMPQVVLYGFGAVAIAVLTAKKKFVTTVIAPIGSSLFIIAGLCFFAWYRTTSGQVLASLSYTELTILGLAGTGACLAFVAIPVGVAWRNGVRLFPSTNMHVGFDVLKTSLWAIAIQAAAAIILGATLYMGNERTGAVVAYQLAFVAFLAPYSIISQSFSTVLLPDLSHHAIDEKDNSTFVRIVENMMTWTYRPMIIITGMCLALYAPIVDLIAGGKASGGHHLVEIIFIALALGIVPYSIYQAISRVFFALEDTRTPALSIFVCACITSIVGIVVARHVTGTTLLYVLGLTHTLSYASAGLFLLFVLSRRGIKVFPDVFTWMTVVISAVIAFVGYLLHRTIEISGRFESLIYSCVFTCALCLIGYLCAGSTHRTRVHRMIGSILHRNQVASENSDA